MTPKEKAKELIFNFSIIETSHFNENMDGKITMEQIGYYSAKQCALIAVDEIIKTSPKYPSDVDWDDVGATHQYYYEAQTEEALRYWQEVKQEIEKL